MNVISKLVVKTCVKLSPQGHLLHHLTDLLLFVLVVDIVFVVFHALLLDQRFHDHFAFPANLQSDLHGMRSTNPSWRKRDIACHVETEDIGSSLVVPKTDGGVFPGDVIVA